MSRSKEGKLREQEAEKKKRRQTKTMIIIIVAVIVVLLAVSLVINSRFIRRSGTAVSVGDMDFSVAEFNYYYFSSYYNYVNTVYSYYSTMASYMLPDTSQPLKAQIYDEDTGETWADVFTQEALNQMKKVSAAYTAAKKAGYEITEDTEAEIETDYTTFKVYSDSYDSFDEYLENYYGKGMTDEIFHDILYKTYYAEAYLSYIKDGFTYTDEDYTKYYNENADDLDFFSFRTFLVKAEYSDESEKETALATAKVLANAYAKDIKTEQDLIDAAKDYNSDTYALDSSTIYHVAGNTAATAYQEWIRDPERKEGDVTVAENPNGNGYYVVYYIGRESNEYPTANIRMISLYSDTVSSSDYETAEAYNEAVAAAHQAIKDEASEILTAWEAEEDKSDDTFSTYFARHNDDDITATGHDSHFRKYQYTDELDAWVFDPARQVGDYKEFYSEDDARCFIVFFEGFGMDYCDYLADTALRGAANDEFLASIEEGMEVKKGLLFSMVG